VVGVAYELEHTFEIPGLNYDDDGSGDKEEREEKR